jgi:hypothetical protein
MSHAARQVFAQHVADTSACGPLARRSRKIFMAVLVVLGLAAYCILR